MEAEEVSYRGIKINDLGKKDKYENNRKKMKLLDRFIKISHVPSALLLSAAFLMQKSAKMIESVDCLAEVIKQTALLVPWREKNERWK